MADLSYYESLCAGCMRPRGKQEGPCEHCGWDEAGYVPWGLPPRSIVGGKYLVGRILDGDGFSITYMGFDLNLELRIAIREYFPCRIVTRHAGSARLVTAYTGKEGECREWFDRFVTEAKTLAKFYALPGIVLVKDYFRENGTAYIVMEHIDGITLKKTLENRGGRLPVKETLAILAPVMEALEQMHGAGVVHRDISPDSIVLTAQGAKLMGFGAAEEYAQSMEDYSGPLRVNRYLPCEQYQMCGEQGPWTDVYALCATIYTCVTGKMPPEAVGRAEKDTLRPPSRFGVFIAPWVESALLKGLAIRKKDRYQDIPRLAAALHVERAQPRYSYHL